MIDIITQPALFDSKALPFEATHPDVVGNCQNYFSDFDESLPPEIRAQQGLNAVVLAAARVALANQGEELSSRQVFALADHIGACLDDPTMAAPWYEQIERVFTEDDPDGVTPGLWRIAYALATDAIATQQLHNFMSE